MKLAGSAAAPSSSSIESTASSTGTTSAHSSPWLRRYGSSFGFKRISEIGALQHNLRQLTEDWGKEKDALLWQQRDDHKGLEEQLTRESADNVKLQSMLEELATSLENVASEKQHWQTRAEHAESDLAVAHQLAGIPNYSAAAVANVPGAGQPGLPPAPQQQGYAVDPTAHVAPASMAMLAPPPGAGGYQYAGQPQTHQAPSVASGYGP